MNTAIASLMVETDISQINRKASFYEAVLKHDPDLHSRVINRARKFQVAIGVTLDAIFEAGAYLYAQREDLKAVPDSIGYRAWLEVEGIGRQTAHNLTTTFERLSPYKDQIEGMHPTLVYELAKPSTPQELLERAIADHSSGKTPTAKAVRQQRQQGTSKGGNTLESVREAYLEDGWEAFDLNPHGASRNRNKYFCQFKGKVITFSGLDNAIQSRKQMQKRLAELKEAIAQPVQRLGDNVVPLRPKVSEPSVATMTVDIFAAPSVPTVVELESAEAGDRQRIANDYYPTDPRLVTGLFTEASELNRIIQQNNGLTFCEPAAGHGAIVEALERLFPGRKITSNEPHPIVAKFDTFEPTYQSDATDEAFWIALASEGLCDVTVMNPPYESTLMLPILQHAVKHSRITAALIRLGYLEPCADRREWLREHSDHLRYWIPVSPRPKFRADVDTSDNVTVSWAVWDLEFSWSKMGMDSPFKFLTDWK